MAPVVGRTVSARLAVVLVALALVVGAVGGIVVTESVRSSAGAAGPPSSPTATPTPAPAPESTPSPTTFASPAARPSGLPTPARTGVPAGTTLTDYTGPVTITTAGTVVDAKEITGCLVIKADDVTIKNSLIRSTCLFNVLSDNGNTGLQLTDVEIDGGDNPASDSAVSGGGYTCLRCDVHGTIDGFKAGTDVTIQDSWIHDLAMTAQSHNDGIQSLGTTRLIITGNTIVLADGATSAIILSTGSATDMRNVTITDNLLGGGAYTVYGGYTAGEDDKAKVSDITISGNRFTTKIHPRCGAYGPLTSTDAPVRLSSNTWVDGPDAGQPVS